MLDFQRMAISLERKVLRTVQLGTSWFETRQHALKKSNILCPRVLPLYNVCTSVLCSKELNVSICVFKRGDVERWRCFREKIQWNGEDFVALSGVTQTTIAVVNACRRNSNFYSLPGDCSAGYQFITLREL